MTRRSDVSTTPEIEKLALSRRQIIKTMAAALVLPALPGLARALPHHVAPALGCSEEFPWFGAHYPDAQCIDGYLWDLDSYEDGLLTSGGDYPCPYCNAREFIEYLSDHVTDEGWIAFCEGEAPLANPYLRGCRFPHLTDAFQRMWADGYRDASYDAIAIEDRRDATALSKALGKDKT